MTMTSQTQSFHLEAQILPVTVTLNFDEDSNWKIGKKNINNGESGRPLATLAFTFTKPKQLRVVRDDNGNDDDDDSGSGDDNDNDDDSGNDDDDSGSDDDNSGSDADNDNNDVDIRSPCQGG